MKRRYDKMTHSDFEDCIRSKIEDTPVYELMAVPGVWELISEHFNDDVLDIWWNSNIENAKARIQKKKADKFLYTGR